MCCSSYIYPPCWPDCGQLDLFSTYTHTHTHKVTHTHTPRDLFPPTLSLFLCFAYSFTQELLALQLEHLEQSVPLAFSSLSLSLSHLGSFFFILRGVQSLSFPFGAFLANTTPSEPPFRVGHWSPLTARCNVFVRFLFSSEMIFGRFCRARAVSIITRAFRSTKPISQFGKIPFNESVPTLSLQLEIHLEMNRENKPVAHGVGPEKKNRHTHTKIR